MPKKKKNTGPHLRRTTPRHQADKLPINGPPISLPSQNRSPMWINIVFFAFLAAVLTPLYFHWKEGKTEQSTVLTEIQSEVLQKKQNYLDRHYRNGVQLISIDADKVELLPYNTLPRDFHVDWKKVRVTQFSYGTIALKIPKVHYGHFATAVETTLARKKDARQDLADVADVKITFEIIDDTGNRVVAAISVLRNL